MKKEANEIIPTKERLDECFSVYRDGSYPFQFKENGDVGVIHTYDLESNQISFKLENGEMIQWKFNPINVRKILLSAYYRAKDKNGDKKRKKVSGK